MRAPQFISPRALKPLQFALYGGKSAARQQTDLTEPELPTFFQTGKPCSDTTLGAILKACNIHTTDTKIATAREHHGTPNEMTNERSKTGRYTLPRLVILRSGELTRRTASTFEMRRLETLKEPLYSLSVCSLHDKDADDEEGLCAYICAYNKFKCI